MMVEATCNKKSNYLSAAFECSGFDWDNGRLDCASGVCAFECGGSRELALNHPEEGIRCAPGESLRTDFIPECVGEWLRTQLYRS